MENVLAPPEKVVYNEKRRRSANMAQKKKKVVAMYTPILLDAPSIPNCLATAKIIYHLPDYFELLQEFIWQDTDILPDLPKLKSFLDFWEQTIEGQLHSVEVATRPLYGRPIVLHTGLQFSIH